MIEYNPTNERIKRQYFIFLKEAKRQSVDTVDAVAMALARFEAYNKYRDFKAFHLKQAVAFKEHLAKQNSKATGKKLSKATIHATLSQLKRFFQWLALQPGYKSKLNYSDAEYFNLSDKDSRIATARRVKKVPTLEQVLHVLRTMPFGSDIERRDRALIAFALLTGARDGAIASIKLKHVDIVERSVFQDAREVNTKFSKSFPTYFFPVGEEVVAILVDWVTYLRTTRLSGNDDPLFPKTEMALDENGQWEVKGLTAEHWSNATAIRRIFRASFALAGLAYFCPHSFRNTLALLGQTACRTPEQYKAWSQNLGHDSVLTTFTSYGQIPHARQAEIIDQLRNDRREPDDAGAEQVAEALLRKMMEKGLVGPKGAQPPNPNALIAGALLDLGAGDKQHDLA